MPPHDFGAVAVIDGRTVKLTPFRTANVPPPIALFEIRTSCTVIDVAFAQDNACMAILHRGGVDLYDWQTRDGRSIVPRISTSCEFKLDGHVENALQVSFSPDGKPFVLYFQDGLKTCALNADMDADKPKLSLPISFEEEVIFTQADAIANGSDQEHLVGVCAQTRAGKLFRVSGQADPLDVLTARLPLQLPWVETVEIEDDHVAFGLSRNGHLYANSRILVKNCTSFLVTCDHLIFTTSNHLLKFVHLSRPEGMPWHIHREKSLNTDESRS